MLTVSESDAASPALIIRHIAHPEHELKLVATGGALLRCCGCRQHGDAEHRYRCEPCDYDLHVCCALPKTHLEHPLLQGSVLGFLHELPAVPAGCSGRSCDACGEPVLSFLYHDGERQTDLHPECATQLPERVVDGGVTELCKEAPAGRGSCVLCGKGQGCSRARFWCYRVHGGGVVHGSGEPRYLHVACIMEAAHSRGQVSAPATGSGDGEVGAAPGVISGRSGKFKSFCKVAWIIARVTCSIASLDPVGAFTAVADFL